MKLEKEQQRQEDKYHIPYHWFIDKSLYKGRIYFGYLSLCLNFLDQHRLSEAKVLEAGCGDGFFLSKLKQAGVKELYGIDYSERALAFAKLFVPESKLVCTDLTEALPYQDNTFNYIFLIETMEHIRPEKISPMLSEFHRVLKDDGRLIITVPSHLMKLNKKHYQHFSLESLATSLEPLFIIEKAVGQNRADRRFLRTAYKFLDNRHWQIKRLSKSFNLNMWPKLFNECRPDQGGRLVIRAKKSKLT